MPKDWNVDEDIVKKVYNHFNGGTAALDHINVPAKSIVGIAITSGK